MAAPAQQPRLGHEHLMPKTQKLIGHPEAAVKAQVQLAQWVHDKEMLLLHLPVLTLAAFRRMLYFQPLSSLTGCSDPWQLICLSGPPLHGGNRKDQVALAF